MSKVRMKTITVGHNKMNTEQMRRAIEQAAQDMVDKGWVLRAHGSRGGVMYATFAMKEKG